MVEWSVTRSRTARPDCDVAPRFRFTLFEDPATVSSRGNSPGPGEIHPDYHETTVTCGCGNTSTPRRTAKSGHIHAETCSACHPFYTGKQRILDSSSLVARFEERYGTRPGRGSN